MSATHAMTAEPMVTAGYERIGRVYLDEIEEHLGEIRTLLRKGQKLGPVRERAARLGAVAAALRRFVDDEHPSPTPRD